MNLLIERSETRLQILPQDGTSLLRGALASLVESLVESLLESLLLPLLSPFLDAFRQHRLDLLQICNLGDTLARQPSREEDLDQPGGEGPPQLGLPLQPPDQGRKDLLDV